MPSAHSLNATTGPQPAIPIKGGKTKLEIRQSFRTVPSRPIALVMAALAVIALALTAWFVLGANARGTVNNRTFVPSVHSQVCGDPYSPNDPVCKSTSDPYSPHDKL